MANIVLTTHGTLGDLHPYLAIGRELQQRGHRPIIATSEYHRRSVDAAALEFRPIRPDISFSDTKLHRRLTEPRRGLERVIRESVLPVLRATYDDLLAVVHNTGADLIVSQILLFAAPLVAEKTGVRWVSTELQPGAFMSAYDPPVLAPLPALAKLRGAGPRFHRALFRVARWTARSWGEPVHRLRRELGLPPGQDPLFEGRHSPELVLALFSRLIGEPQPDWPPNTLVTGFPFYDHSEPSLSPELADFLDDGEPPIVFTLGSSAVWDAGSFYTESVAAARKLGRRALLLGGSNTPSKDILCVPYVPYREVFARASAIVHHGGIGTTAQALRAGKPMLVMPIGGDQYDNGARVERLGVAKTIMRNNYTADRVAFALNELSHYSENAIEAGLRVRAEMGVQLACDALTSHHH